jgi:hypothetical protein
VRRSDRVGQRKAWQAPETNPDTLATLAPLDRLLDEHTDAETAEALNTAGHRSGEGKPFTGRIVLDLRRAHNMPSHAERLRARGLLDMAQIAEHLGVHRTTIKNWHRAGLLVSHKANDKNQRLFEPPAPADQTPASSPDKEARSETEFPPNPRQEVQCETQALDKPCSRVASIRGRTAVMAHCTASGHRSVTTSAIQSA